MYIDIHYTQLLIFVLCFLASMTINKHGEKRWHVLIAELNGLLTVSRG